MARDPNVDNAKAIWDECNGDVTNREIARQLGIDERKVSVWKGRYDWAGKNDKKPNVVQQKKKRCTTKKKSVVQQNENLTSELDKAMISSVEENEV